MNLLLRCVIFLLLHPYLYSKPYIIDGLVQNGIGTAETVERPLQAITAKDFSWAKENQTCSQLLEDCREFLGLLLPSSSWLLEPALALGFLQVGCLTEQDRFFLDLIKDDDARRLFNIMAEQFNTPIHQTTAPHNSQQHLHKFDLLRFNLESIYLNALDPSHHKHCSGIQQEEQNVLLKGFILGFHSSLHHAQAHCRRLGPVCAGVSFETLGQYKSVARNGGYIVPHAGSKLWLHRCIGEHLRRRSTDPECQSEKELHIYKVMQWIPVVSGYYSAGSAVYYASQGCSGLAEDRAIEASVDLGYDSLFVATGGVSGAISAGVGMGVKPALKDGVKSAINYFKAQLSR
ncbi:apolipoprotein F [Bufo gargarizans]|uniref:apolipoprotein F n=1 Tax=Bufo gargarizans TaxID=30331 RepID=UPI001CF30EA4|nr:apolipoprotein F [Bufo gargarizans]XP_044142686.1 apolipoprotein F [Bufo gargarizans]XP_044142687.1 apolipoprotein F [Bufo gargarizans]